MIPSDGFIFHSKICRQNYSPSQIFAASLVFPHFFFHHLNTEGLARGIDSEQGYIHSGRDLTITLAQDFLLQIPKPRLTYIYTSLLFTTQ